MALPVVMAAIAGGAALAKGISGAVQASKARKALENFQRQELRNVTEGMRVSTLGAQLNTQEAQRRFSTAVDALRSGGVRGVVGGLGAQEQLMQNQQASIAAELDRQQVMIDRLRAQDEQRIQGMQEQRETFDIGRLAGQQAAGRAQLSSAIGDVAGLATSFISPAGEGRAKDLKTLDTSLTSGNFEADLKRRNLFGPKQVQFTENSQGNLMVKGRMTGGLSGNVITSPVSIPQMEYNIKPVQ